MAEHPVTAGNGDAPEDGTVPPASEQLHLPGPTYLPVVVAAGVTLALVGVVINVALLVIGLLVTVIAAVRWVREARAEIAELPLSH